MAAFLEEEALAAFLEEEACSQERAKASQPPPEEPVLVSSLPVFPEAV